MFLRNFYGVIMDKENLVYSWDASTTLMLLLGLLNVFQLVVSFKVEY